MGTGKGNFDYKGYRAKIRALDSPRFGRMYETEITKIGNKSEPLAFQQKITRDITVATANARGLIDRLAEQRDLQEKQARYLEANTDTPLGEQYGGE